MQHNGLYRNDGGWHTQKKSQHPHKTKNPYFATCSKQLASLQSRSALASNSDGFFLPHSPPCLQNPDDHGFLPIPASHYVTRIPIGQRTPLTSQCSNVDYPISVAMTSASTNQIQAWWRVLVIALWMVTRRNYCNGLDMSKGLLIQLARDRFWEGAGGKWVKRGERNFLTF